MRIIIGSKNPIKIQSAELAFKSIFNTDFELLNVSPKITVSNTPTSINEMIDGAQQRAIFAIKSNFDCDYGVGIEGGLFLRKNFYYLTAYSVIVDKDENIGEGGSPVIKLPTSWKIFPDRNFEFGDFVDKKSKRSNIKQQEGAMGYLTENKLDRREALKFSVLCAFYSLKNELFL